MDDNDIDILIKTTKASHDRNLARIATGDDVRDFAEPLCLDNFLLAKVSRPCGTITTMRSIVWSCFKLAERMGEQRLTPEVAEIASQCRAPSAALVPPRGSRQQ